MNDIHPEWADIIIVLVRELHSCQCVEHGEECHPDEKEEGEVFEIFDAFDQKLDELSELLIDLHKVQQFEEAQCNHSDH